VNIPDPLPLRNIAVPREVTRVTGCDCAGSLELHETRCAIWALPHDQALAAIDAASDRLGEYTAALNARLRSAT
jgi:hypothetical protein